MHRNSMKMMRYFRDKYLRDAKGSTVLDVGSRLVTEGQETYRELFEREYRYSGMDVMPGPNVDIVGYENIQKVYDVVISGQTMEHLIRPWDWMTSLVAYFSRFICIIAPHTASEHRFPIDTYRYLPDGMRDLFGYAGIKELEIVKGRMDTMGIGTK